MLSSRPWPIENLYTYVIIRSFLRLNFPPVTTKLHMYCLSKPTQFSISIIIHPKSFLSEPFCLNDYELKDLRSYSDTATAAAAAAAAAVTYFLRVAAPRTEICQPSLLILCRRGLCGLCGPCNLCWSIYPPLFPYVIVKWSIFLW